MSIPVATPTPVEGLGFWETLRRGSEFLMGRGDVRETLARLAEALRREDISYAVIGGMALVAHGYARFTEDVDLLMTPEGLAAFRERFVGRGYRPAFDGASKTFRDAETGVRVEIVTSGEFPGDGEPKPVSFPDPAESRVEHAGVFVVRVEKLVELKLASGLSARHRLKDLADVQELIAHAGLPEELAESLDPSVQEEYRRLWHDTQTPDRPR